MSGHSKWSTIKRQKAVTDARRSSVFTKFARLITVAARTGGKDPSMNFQLRLAIDKAKAANMPNDNIDRAIKSGVGKLKSEQAKEVLYEGFGPGGVAVLAQTITDNTNRTAADLRRVFHQYGGRLGGQNSVAWMFHLRGIIRLPLKQLQKKSAEDIELGAIDAGAEEVGLAEGRLDIVTALDKLHTIDHWLTSQEITGYSATSELWPQTTVAIDDPTRQRLHRLLEALDDQADVTEIHSNDA